MKRILTVIKSEKEWLGAVFDLKVSCDFRNSARVCSAEGWLGSDDVLDAHLIFFVEKGVIEGVVDGREILAEEGSAIWIQPGSRRQFRLKNGYPFTRNIRVRFNFWRGKKKLLFSSILIKRDAWGLYPYLQAIYRNTKMDGQFSALEIRGVMAGFFARLFDLNDSETGSFRTFSDSERSAIERLVGEKLFDGLQPLDMAKASGFCMDYFTRVFKQTYGIPPRSYLLRERIRSAAELLIDTNLTLKEICNEIGEEDLSKFCRQFQKLYQCTPTQYRRFI
jgi:AraC-like DNA-binding protein